MNEGPVIFSVTARRAVRSATLWGSVFALYAVASASGYASAYPSGASRAKLARSLVGNSGLAAIIGPAQHLDTVAGFTSWRCMGTLTVVGAVWGLFAATRLLRGEEDAGRWELLLAGRTTRSGAVIQAVLGLAAGAATIVAVTAMCMIPDGWTSTVRLSASASAFFSLAVAVGAAMFLAIGVLVGQLAASRRQANAIGAAVLGVAYLLRMVADSDAGRAWLRWASPLGWAENLRPLVGTDLFPLVPCALLVCAAVGAATWLAASRDVGGSALPAEDRPRPRTRLLDSPARLIARLSGPAALGWWVGLAACGVVFGLVSQSAADAVSGSAEVQRILARLGGHRLGAAAYLGITLAFASALVCFAAASQISSTRAEEADGFLDHLLVRPVGRRPWLVERLTAGAVVVFVAGELAGVAGWLGAAIQHTGVGFGQLLEAGLNIVPPALAVLGVGALVFGVAPRWAPAACYALVAWSFLVEIVAGTVKLNHWIVDTSVLRHVAPVPAANPDWMSAGGLTLLALVAAGVGVVAFGRRDLVSE